MENVERIVASEVESPKEENIDRALRPLKLADYVGQSAIKEQLSIFITAAKQRHEPLDHLLLFGPPGLGKTTLAHIIANEMGVNLRQTSGPVLERPGDLAAILTNLEKNDVILEKTGRLRYPFAGMGTQEKYWSAKASFQVDRISPVFWLRRSRNAQNKRDNTEENN